MTRKHRNRTVRNVAFGALAGLALAAGCGGGSSTPPGGTTAAVNCTGSTCEVKGEIKESTTFASDKTYVLKNLVFVLPPAVLTIEAGTTIKGDRGSALIVARGAKLSAVGTASAPIVFTSNQPVGQRNRGDWGGVVLLGRATINVTGGENNIEGIADTDDRGKYGGTDDEDSSGTLKYIRIEFAGFELTPNNELNGLTCGGCGRGTVLDYIQVHRGADDGIELFGGTVDLKHVVITLPNDDGLDWDFGWRGRAQFVVVQQEAANGNNGYEADNNADNNTATPMSKPTIYNATLVGSDADPSATADTQRGMVLRRGTGGLLYNHVVIGFSKTAIDVRDDATVANTASGDLMVKNSLFFSNGANDIDFPQSDIGPGSFDEDVFFKAQTMTNQFGTDPQLGAPFNLTAPDWLPAAGSVALSSGATPPSDGFFDTSATFIGAFGAVNWAAGWTAFPEN